MAFLLREKSTVKQMQRDFAGGLERGREEARAKLAGSQAPTTPLHDQSVEFCMGYAQGQSQVLEGAHLVDDVAGATGSAADQADQVAS